jgi:hypothetical protein
MLTTRGVKQPRGYGKSILLHAPVEVRLGMK